MGTLYSFQLFGSFQVVGDGRAIHFARRKSEALLAYLALHAGPQPREKLAGLFWGDSPDEDARRALRVVLADLRKNLGDDLFIGDRDTLGLNLDLVAELDTRQFSELLRKPEHASAQQLEAALGLYRGDLLDGMYDEWLLPLREHFRSNWLMASLLLIERQRTEGDYTRAIHFARSHIDREPASEKAYQHLIFCLAANGDQEAALQQADACRQALQKYMGADLSAETEALIARIQQRTTEGSAARLGNLPRPLTSFVGREDELNEVETLLEETRLLTLLGPGGTGKTRLAIQAADEVAFHFPGGVWWVDFSPLEETELVIQSIARSLGVKERGDASLLDLIVYQIGETPMLLVLDNCEHLLAAIGHAVAHLLAHCPALKVLATSREPLDLGGELGWQVPTLPLPVVMQDLKLTRKNEAVRLFVERARGGSTFSLDESNASVVVDICRRLQGIPLALELAAAQLGQLSLLELADRLTQTLDLGQADALGRRATLRATIQWSYDLLTLPQQILFRRLGVFRGGWDLNAATIVAAGYSEPDEIVSTSKQARVSPIPVSGEMITRQMLENLVRKGLIQPRHSSDGLRFAILDTIREFARERMAESEDAEALPEVHYDYFVTLVENAQAEMRGPDFATWMRSLDLNQDNLRAALEWATEQGALPALRLAGALMDYWTNSRSMREGVGCLQLLLARPDAQGQTLARARALGALAFMYEAQLENIPAVPCAAEALEIYRALGDQPGEAFALWMLGSALCGSNDFQAGRSFVFESLALYRALEDPFGVSEVLCALGNFVDDADPQRARMYMTESLDLARRLGTPAAVAARLANLGRIDCRAGDFVSARQHLSESLALHRKLGIEHINFVVEALGELAVREGNYEEARQHFEEAIEMARKGGLQNANYWIYSFLGFIALRQNDYKRARTWFLDAQAGFYKANLKLGVAYSMEGLASLALAQNDPGRAARLYSWADAARVEVDNPRPPVEQLDVDREVEKIRAMLGADEFDQAREQGATMSMEDAMAYALQSG